LKDCGLDEKCIPDLSVIPEIKLDLLFMVLDIVHKL
jgi:hypothetical protein